MTSWAAQLQEVNCQVKCWSRCNSLFTIPYQETTIKFELQERKIQIEGRVIAFQTAKFSHPYFTFKPPPPSAMKRLKTSACTLTKLQKPLLSSNCAGPYSQLLNMLALLCLILVKVKSDLKMKWPYCSAFTDLHTHVIISNDQSKRRYCLIYVNHWGS